MTFLNDYSTTYRGLCACTVRPPCTAQLGQSWEVELLGCHAVTVVSLRLRYLASWRAETGDSALDPAISHGDGEGRPWRLTSRGAPDEWSAV